MPNNTPKQPARSDADKEKSRQQSRTVSGKSGQGKGGQSRPGQGKGGQPATSSKSGGGGQRPPRPTKGKPTPAPVPKRNPATFFTWGIVGLVIVIVVVLVVVKVTSGGTTNSSGIKAFRPVPASVATELTSVSASVFNKVGITASATQVSPPVVVPSQPPLTFGSGSAKQPGIYYYGAEYCPYCAAERWALILSLSRFGTLGNLGLMQSSSTDIYKNTPTFTFSKATYTSKYFAARLDEYLSNQVGASGQYIVNQQPTPQEAALVKKYDSPTYFGGQPDNYPAFPFIDFGNKVLQLSASYSPALLGNLTQQQIAQGLDDPTNPVTQALAATSNYLTAGICKADGEKPASVCASKGVKTADKSLKLSS